MLGFMKKKKEETISYGVIGLGKFGYTLAIQLAEYGYDFLVVDKDENLVQDLRTVTESAIVVDDYDKKSIKDSGVKNCDVVIVCLEEQYSVCWVATSTRSPSALRLQSAATMRHTATSPIPRYIPSPRFWTYCAGTALTVTSTT